VKGTIDFEVMESNAQGVLALMAYQKAIDGGKKDAHVITLIMAVPFFPDAMKIQAKLCVDFAGVDFYVPTMASPFFNQISRVLGAMAKAVVEDEEDAVTCAETEKTYRTEATRIQMSKKSQVQKISIRFPDGVTCNKNHFNEGAEGKYGVTMNIASMMGTDPQFTDKNGRPVQWPLSFAFCRLVVDGTEKDAKVSKKDPTATISKMMSGVGLSGALICTLLCFICLCRSNLHV